LVAVLAEAEQVGDAGLRSGPVAAALGGAHIEVDGAQVLDVLGAAVAGGHLGQRHPVPVVVPPGEVGRLQARRAGAAAARRPRLAVGVVAGSAPVAPPTSSSASART